MKDLYDHTEFSNTECFVKQCKSCGMVGRVGRVADELIVIQLPSR